MLHKVLEQEKDLNYPTIRAVLCEYYGNQFKEAKITAVPEGQESYSFVAELANGQEYFFKIEKNKIKPNETRKKRQEMICQFMAYLHDQHQLDSASINSAKILKANNGEFIPNRNDNVKI